MKNARLAVVIVGAIFVAAVVCLLVITLTWPTVRPKGSQPRANPVRPGGRQADEAVPGAAAPVRAGSGKKAEPAAVPESKQVPPAGSVSRPANGYESEELDVAWQEYGKAISAEKTRLIDAMNRLLKKATDGKRFNEAKKYSDMIDGFHSEGTFPADCEILRTIAKTVRENFEKASRKLEKKYTDLRGSLTKDNQLAAADAVDKEWAELKKILDAVRPPDDAVKIGKHSYRAYDAKVSQAEAVNECRQRGGYLARITEQEEFAVVGNRLRSEKKKIQLWIDGTDASKEGDWKALDGTALGDIRWALNQPDDANGRQNGLTVWVYEDKKLGWLCGMNDAPEKDRHGYICEWDD